VHPGAVDRLEAGRADDDDVLAELAGERDALVPSPCSAPTPFASTASSTFFA
jgi:hypothetical protein